MKPILFHFDPESVHDLFIHIGALLGKCVVTRAAVSFLYQYKGNDTSKVVDGITYHTPVLLAAGFDNNGKLTRILKSISFSGEEVGSVTAQACEGNLPPRMTRLIRNKSIVVYKGLRNRGVDALIKRLKRTRRVPGFVIGVSIAKTNTQSANSSVEAGIADYVETFKKLNDAKVGDYYAINISCPNSFGGEPCTTPQDLDDLLQAVDKLRVRRPVFVKFPIDKTWPETKKLLDVCARHAVQGITLGNLYKDRASVQLQEKFDTSIKGNFSGKPCWEKSNELLEKMYAHYNHRFVFSGVGGVFSAEDAYTKIRLGASVVEFITGLIFQGPAVVGQMNRELAALLKRDGFEHVSDAIGVDVKQMKEK
jgi:dihydroorotate dehydrogenase subfamily 2